MNTLILITFISTLLPFLAKIPVALAMHRKGGYDNRHPRQQQSQLTDFGARALAAHQNSFEALIIFGIAMATAMTTNTTNEVVIYLVVTHLVARVLYCVLYWFDINIIRSIVWGIGTVASFAIIWQCLSF
ncbi:MAG: MAPEG family protein [Psychrobium sp.]